MLGSLFPVVCVGIFQNKKQLEEHKLVALCDVKSEQNPNELFQCASCRLLFRARQQVAEHIARGHCRGTPDSRHGTGIQVVLKNNKLIYVRKNPVDPISWMFQKVN